MASGYVKRPGFRAEDALDKEKYKAALVKRADAAVEFAQQVAPVGTITHMTKGGYVNKPGDYKRGLKTIVRRGKVYASATDWKSHWVEYGGGPPKFYNVPNRPSAPLRRGLQAVGKLRGTDR